MAAATDGLAPVQGTVALVAMRRLRLAEVGALFHCVFGLGGQFTAGGGLITLVVLFFGLACLFALSRGDSGGVGPLAATGFLAADVAFRGLAFSLALQHGREPGQEVALLAAVCLEVAHEPLRGMVRGGWRVVAGVALLLTRSHVGERTVLSSRARLALLLQLPAGRGLHTLVGGGGVRCHSGECHDTGGEHGAHHLSPAVCGCGAAAAAQEQEAALLVARGSGELRRARSNGAGYRQVHVVQYMYGRYVFISYTVLTNYMYTYYMNTTLGCSWVPAGENNQNHPGFLVDFET